MKGRRYPIEGLEERLEDIQIKSGLSQVEFARRACINRKTLRECMDGRSSPSVQSLAHICAAHNVSADYLLFGKNK